MSETIRTDGSGVMDAESRVFSMNDLISRQAAIQEIKDLPDCQNGYSDTYDKAQIIGVLEELPSAQPEQRWIPCSERLPELDVPIVFTTAIGTLDVGFRIDADTMNQFYSETGKCRRDNYDVIAWQPLPEPYKEEKE